MKEKRLPAYTLLELLMVLTIIGVLMATGMVVYSRIQLSALKKAAQIEMKQFPLAILSYRLDYQENPASPSELLDGGFITRELATDPWGNDYRLEYGEDGRTVRVLSAGPDKKIGTKDDLSIEENI